MPVIASAPGTCFSLCPRDLHSIFPPAGQALLRQTTRRPLLLSICCQTSQAGNSGLNPYKSAGLSKSSFLDQLYNRDSLLSSSGLSPDTADVTKSEKSVDPGDVEMRCGPLISPFIPAVTVERQVRLKSHLAHHILSQWLEREARCVRSCKTSVQDKPSQDRTVEEEAAKHHDMQPSCPLAGRHMELGAPTVRHLDCRLVLWPSIAKRFHTIADRG